jgi:hypothetical protein
MDGKRFDSLARTIGRRRSRRGAFQALSAAALTAISARIGLSEEPVAAAQVTTERRFNCSAVGKRCNGNDSNCCSGRCEGKGAKKGKKKKGKKKKDRKDKSKCVAHDDGGCTSGEDTCATGIAVACGHRGNGGCFQTTGNAGFCSQIDGGSSPPRFACADCNRDQDCVDQGFGNDAACVVCNSNCEFQNNNATACVGPED